jgi:hypothetical protein
LGDPRNQPIGNVEATNYFLVQDTHPTCRYRTHRQLLAPGNAQFSYQENVQGRWKSLGNFESYRYTAARKSENQYVRPMGVSVKPGCQRAPSIDPVAKSSTHFFSEVLEAALS